MILDLLNAKKITPGEADTYNLYQANELGRKCLSQMMQDTYMDEPTKTEFTGVGFAYYDGRRSVFRDINRVIMKIEALLHEVEHDGTDAR